MFRWGGAARRNRGGGRVDHNRREELSDATAHAEILVISARARAIGEWRLNGHTLVVTLDPARDVRRRRGTGPPRSHRLWGC